MNLTENEKEMYEILLKIQSLALEGHAKAGDTHLFYSLTKRANEALAELKMLVAHRIIQDIFTRIDTNET